MKQNEMKQNELTTEDFKTLFTMCDSWIRKNENADTRRLFPSGHRKNSLDEVKKVKQKVFNQFKHTI